MIAAEVSRPECSKLRELEFERNLNFFHQIMSFKAVISHAVFELSPRTSDSPEGVLEMGAFRELCLHANKKTSFAIKPVILRNVFLQLFHPLFCVEEIL